MSTTTNIEDDARRMRDIKARAAAGTGTADDLRDALRLLHYDSQLEALEELTRWRRALAEIRTWAEGWAGKTKGESHSDTARARLAGRQTGADEVLEILARTGALAEVPRGEGRTP